MSAHEYEDSEPSGTDIAMVGMALRVPGARSVDQYWANLLGGVEARTELSEEELLAAGVDRALLSDPRYVRAGMFLQDMECFDHALFGLSARDAAIMDPQHRHFLECAWAALEDAGYDPARFPGAIGVFAGSGHNAYLPYNLLPNARLLRDVGFFLLRHTGNDKDFLTTRVSYQLNLRGPSVAVATACSTSLVAVHLACQSLLSGECDLALAGGVTIELPHRQGYLCQEGEILSPDGRCRPFSARAAGTVFGSGAGVVALRRLQDAIDSGDFIHAIIKGSAVNNDGAGKVSYLAPSVDGQAQCVAEALKMAGVRADSIGLVEAHGTGTALGDPIEIAALTQVFRRETDRRQFCAVGSVKSNIGHLDTAAGIASLVKAALALRHGQIPPTLHFEGESPAIDLAASPFYVNAEARPWPAGPRGPSGSRRRAGVTSLGVGGTNAHVILEEAPPRRAAAKAARPFQLLPLSANSEDALDDLTDAVAERLRADAQLDLADAAFTLQTGRRALPLRRFVVCGTNEEAAAALPRAPALRAPAERRQVAFLLSGGGAQHPGMAAGLYAGEPAFRAAVDECLALLPPDEGAELRRLLYPAKEAAAEAATALQRPARGLPALFITQYALARLWRSLGVEPAALLGHSLGENTAACLAGVLSLEDALGLVRLRGQLFERVPPGAMLSVARGEAELAPLLQGRPVSVAAANAPALTVLSGPAAAIAELEGVLQEREIEHQRVHIDVAAHSAMLDPILPEFRAYLRGVRLSAPKIPILSNLTGDWLRPEEATDPEYWVRHLRQTVRFADGMSALLKDPATVLLEVGPGKVLATLATAQPSFGAGHVALTSLGPRDGSVPDQAALLGALGRLWQAGVAVPFERLHAGDAGDGRRRAPLPTYPFRRVRHWIDAPRRSAAEAGEPEELVRQPDPARWFYEPRWHKAPLPPVGATALAGRRVLLLGDLPGDGLAASLAAAGAAVEVAQPGERFASLGPGQHRLREGAPEDHEALLSAASAGGAVTDIVHALTLAPGAGRAAAFDSLVALGKALAARDGAPRLTLLTSEVQQVAGEPVSSALPGLALGVGPVLGAEIEGLRFRAIDLPRSAEGSWQRRLAQGQLVAELAAGEEDLVAYRGPDRFAARLEPAPLPEAPPLPRRVRAGGVYLITGGLGGLGLLCAEALAAAARVKLVLLGRGRGGAAVAPRDSWDAFLAANDPEHPACRLIRRLQALEARADVLVLRADVTRRADLEAALRTARARFGAISGVIHAAGVLEEGLLLQQEPEAVERVLGPKLTGTQLLDELLPGPLDFFLLFSSISAFAGLPGQAAYAAANAFLDAFARQRRARDGAFTAAIDWTAWREVGMVARAGAPTAPGGRRASHPLLGRCVEEGAGPAVYSAELRPEEHWVLGEHRVRGGGCVVPGAGYLEIARAALCDQQGAGPVEIRDVFFLLPFAVEDGGARELRTRLEPEDDGTIRFSMLSPDGAGGLQEHVTGALRRPAPAAARRIDVASLLRRCQDRVLREGPPAGAHMEFGPRWACLPQLGLGRGEAVAQLSLPTAYRDEFAAFPLHPALLDMAAATGAVLVEGFDAARDFYVPVGCGRLVQHAALAAEMVSHLRYRPQPGGRREHDIAVFDVTIADREGQVLVEIEELTMKRVGDRAQLAKAAGPRYLERMALDGAAERGRAEQLQRVLATAIAPAEGAEALRRVLHAAESATVIVSTHPLQALLGSLRAPPPAAARRGKGAPESADARSEAEDGPALAEAAARLQRHESVREAAVRAFQAGAEGRRVVAFVVHHPGQQATASELRRFLRGQVDAQHLPQHFVELDALPRGQGGAVDLAALRDPLGGPAHAPPRTATERTLARIWQEVLSIERVGLHDNFFDLGGHSLLSIRAITRAQKQLGVHLNQALMALQTLEQIAAECDRQRGGAPEASAPGPAPDAPTGPAVSAAPQRPKDLKSRLLDRVLGRS